MVRAPSWRIMQWGLWLCMPMIAPWSGLPPQPHGQGYALSHNPPSVIPHGQGSLHSSDLQLPLSTTTAKRAKMGHGREARLWAGAGLGARLEVEAGAEAGAGIRSGLELGLHLCAVQLAQGAQGSEPQQAVLY